MRSHSSKVVSPLSGPAVAIFLATGAFYVAYEIAVTFLIQPYVYFGMTAIFLAFNLCPILIVIARSTHVAQIKPGRLWTRRICYAVALAFLIAYAVLVLLVTAERSVLGFVTMGAVLLTDMVVLLMFKSNIVFDPIALTAILFLCRAALVGVGQTYWFFGHMSLYVFFGVFLSYLLAKKYMPTRDSAAELRNALGPPTVLSLVGSYFLSQATIRWMRC